MAKLVFSLVFLLLVQVSLVWGRDFYDVLSLPRSATDAQIKRAYRKLALQYHPDKVAGTEVEKEAAAKKFSEIGHAYEVLSDNEKRKIYDQHGEEGLKQNEQGGGGGGGGQDIFSFFFGGQRGGEEVTPKGHDVFVELPVTLRDLYLGKELRITRDKNVVKSAPGTRQCKCKNKVKTKQIAPGMYQQYHVQECEKCPNVKLEREQETLTVHVEPGMQDGEHINFFEEGEPLIDGETGDLKFILRTQPSDKWERRGNDLLINETISLVDALVGFSRDVEHLDGHLVTLATEGITKPGLWRQYRGEGMPVLDTNARGDLWVQFTIDFPKTQLSAEQKKAVQELFQGVR
eukprot:gene7528-677_t